MYKETVDVAPLPHEVTAEDCWTRGYAGRIRLRVLRPETDTDDVAAPLHRPGVLYLHGNGFMCGSIDNADAPAHRLTATLPAVVVTADYSLTPATPFSAAPEDIYATLYYAADHAGAQGIDHRRIAVAGHNAGDNLSAALSVIARDHDDPHLRTWILIAPMLNPTMTRVRPDHLANTDNSTEVCTDYYRRHLPRPVECMHLYAAPVEPRRLQGLSPALPFTAPQDLLRTKVKHCVARPTKVGIITQVMCVDRAYHNSITMSVAAQGEMTCFLH